MDRETEESICDIQAHLYAQHIVLRALARSHPVPVELLAPWRATSMEAAMINPPVSAHARNSDYLANTRRAYSEERTT